MDLMTILWAVFIFFVGIALFNLFLIVWMGWRGKQLDKHASIVWLQDMQDNHDEWILALRDNPEGVAILSKEEVIGDMAYHFSQRAKLEVAMRALGKKGMR